MAARSPSGRTVTYTSAWVTGVRDARDWILAARERGATVLVSSHLLSEVERTCDRIAIVHEGRIVASGARDELLQPGENLEDAFVRVVGG